jgi:hypothetical protein
MTDGAFERSGDRSLYWTLSFYIDRDTVSQLLGAAPTPAQLRMFQTGYRDSRKLRDAIEPLFNDIADRERLGAIDDFLLSTPCPMAGEEVTIEAPDVIEWKTEGTTFRSSPPGLARPRTMRMRRFWYAHLNGAYSHHMSFRVDYEHDIGDFYFLSLLHKAAAPKEFEVHPRDTPWRPTEEGSGLFPAENLFVTDAKGVRQTLWRFLAAQVETDASDLFGALAAQFAKPAPKGWQMSFDQLVRHAPFIEVPGLSMPTARFMFFFQDEVLFKRLLPPINPQTGARPSRTSLVQEPCYAPYSKKIQQLIEARPSGEKVELDAAYWDWAIHRKDYGDISEAQLAKIRETIPAFEPQRRDCLQYLFLAGFNQNIVDFMNQDASEILDSTDPIYPTDLQSDESFFVRFANPRALITYVQNSRSLETGNDYIGTCPYAFLIHVVSLHNEFLARDYEAKTFALVDGVRKLNESRKLKRAADRFYDFRMSTYSDYVRFRYGNVFRYDTERDVFLKMEELRGTTRKEGFLEVLVTNTESQTRDLEARISKGEEQTVSLTLGALGLFGLFQLMFQWAVVFGEDSKVRASWTWPFFTPAPGGEAGALTLATLYLSIGFTALIALAGAFALYAFIRRQFR